jgi:hypothetical protein
MTAFFVFPETRRKTSFGGTKPAMKSSRKTNKDLLVCGILSSVFYVAMNIIVAFLYQGYDTISQTVSELSAIGAPTRLLWVAMSMLYTLLFIAFVRGVQRAAGANRPLRLIGKLLLAYGLIGFAWPFAPMHQREVLAAGGGTFSDTLHIAFSFITVPLMLLAIGFGAAAFGKGFRIYSIGSLIVLCIFGVLTGIEGPKLAKNLPTPWLGIYERILIAVFLLWVIALAYVLIRQNKMPATQ